MTARLACFALALAVILDAGLHDLSAAEDRTACAKAENCREDVAVAPGVLLPVYASYPLTKADPLIQRALIIIHGLSRNADGYFRTGVAGAKKVDRTATTLVVAPAFTLLGDVKNRPAGEIYWDRAGGWPEGSVSTKSLSGSISSYAAMDAIVRRLGDHTLFPNLTSIVIAGHSAGGQFVQRYAAAQPADLVPAGITLRFIVANPSTYLYFGKERPLADGSFGIPKTSCSYNNYKYGLDNRRDYMAKADGQTLARQYREREVVYMLGEKDTNPNDPELDVSCPAMTQGPFRLERGRSFMAYMTQFFSPNRHRIVEVAESGHSRNGMFLSNAGLAALYN